MTQTIKLLVETDEAADKLRTIIDHTEDVYEISKLSRKVEKLGEAMRAYQESGITWKVFNRYLRGTGIPQGEIDNVMRGVKDFFAQFDIEIEE